jgi:hypothetical protein
MRRLLILVTALLLSLVVLTGPAFAHPLSTPGTERGVGGPLDKAQGHFNGLPCAELVSPVLGPFPGTFCDVDLP